MYEFEKCKNYVKFSFAHLPLLSYSVSDNMNKIVIILKNSVEAKLEILN